jgi:hypothetical protein
MAKKSKATDAPLPDPPLLVLAKQRRSQPVWLTVARKDGHRGPLIAVVNGLDWIEARELTVVDHPRNDPEAVEIIKNAKAKCPQ